MKHVFITIMVMVFALPGLASAEISTVQDFVKALTPSVKTRGLGGIRKEEKPKAVMHLQFDLDSAALKPKPIVMLRKLGMALQTGKLNGYIYRLEGHTCDLGDEGYNLELSQRRAVAVRDYLVRTFDMSPEQFQVQGFGERNPVAPNVNETNRNRNRRVVIYNTLKPFRPGRRTGEAKIEVIVKYKESDNDRPKTLKEGEVLTQNHSYAVEFTAKGDAYVYIFQIDSAGKTSRLFPNPQFAIGRNPVTGGSSYRIPSRSWFVLDETRGKEEMIAIANKAPVPDPDRICLELASSNKRGIEGIRDDIPQQKMGKPQAKENLFIWRISFQHR